MRTRLMGLLVGGVIAAAMVPGMASARGPGGFHSGGFHHGGFHHGGFHHGFGPGFGIGFGLGYPYYGGYSNYYPYTYEDLGGCYVARQRVRTAYGWRYRNVEVCE